MNPNQNQTKKTGRLWIILLIGLVVLILYRFPIIKGCSQKTIKQTQESATKLSTDTNYNNQTSYDNQTASGVTENKPKNDFQSLETNTTLNALMTKRKDKLGVADSLDMIVKENEEFCVGNKKVSMQDILRKIKAQKGQVYEETIQNTEKVTPEYIKEYGIYVVRPKDNIWNIHFKVLKDYFASKNIPLSPSADEPGSNGTSSGIGKILKFSEAMISIYNLQEDKLVYDINLIEPLSKIIIYNMNDIFLLLEDLDYKKINRIEFDGTNIWIPAETN